MLTLFFSTFTDMVMRDINSFPPSLVVSEHHLRIMIKKCITFTRFQESVKVCEGREITLTFKQHSDN